MRVTETQTASLALPLVRGGLLAGAVLLLQACAGGGEDPRVTLCRGLAADFSSIDKAQWASDGNRFVRPEYAEVKVKAGEEAASCYYEYEIVEETVVDHADPLQAYSTLPYRMSYNGVDVAEASLRAAVMVQQKEAPAEALRQAQEAVEQAKQQIQKAVESAQNR